MTIRVALTGPPRVVLGRSVVDLTVPGEACTVDDVLARLAEVEPRIARYLRGADGHPPAFLRPLVNDRVLDRGVQIPDGTTVTLVYAVAGGVPRKYSIRRVSRPSTLPQSNWSKAR